MNALQPLDLPVTLIHDRMSADLAALAAEVLGKQMTRLMSLDVHEEEGEFGAGQYWLIYDLQTIDRAIDLQDQIVAAGGEVIAVGQEPGLIWFGPRYREGSNGCLRCFKLWVANNRREPQHWSASQATGAPLRGASQAPMSPAARALAKAQIAIMAGPHSAAKGHPLGKMARRLSSVDLSCAAHEFIPLPDCISCSTMPEDSPEGAILNFQSRLKASPEASRADNPLLSMAKLRDAFVDRQTGLIKHVFNDLTSNLMPMAAAEAPIMGSDTIEQGFGRTETVEGSKLVGMLEALERFSGHKSRGKRINVRGSYSEISAQYGDRCLHPSIYELHTAEQYAQSSYVLTTYTDDLTFDWCWGYSTLRREPVLVPLQLAYYWLPRNEERPVNRFLYDSSNGCALGGSVEEAALHGIYEVVERDAYLTSWYARLPPREIDLSTLTDPKALALLARARAEGFVVHMFDMRLDIDIPAVWGMIIDRRPDAEVASYCASAAHGDWDRALFSALVEITTSIGVYRKSMPELRDKAYEMVYDPWKVADMHDHVLLYSLPETLPRLDFILEGETVSFETCRLECPSMRERDLTRELEIQIERVLKVAKDVIVVVQDFPALNAVGLSSVRVIAPGLTPITFGHQYRRFSLERLNNAARVRGRPELSSRDDVNPEPHNFP
jgi:ribosomal protein S12 methylthiotransferase accessory factor